MAELPRRRLILLHRRDSGKGLEVRRRVQKQGDLGKGSVSTWSLGRTLSNLSVGGLGLWNLPHLLLARVGKTLPLFLLQDKLLEKEEVKEPACRAIQEPADGSSHLTSRSFLEQQTPQVSGVGRGTRAGATSSPSPGMLLVACVRKLWHI